MKEIRLSELDLKILLHLLWKELEIDKDEMLLQVLPIPEMSLLEEVLREELRLCRKQN